ncbi:MAG: hypothetical protein R3301_18055 [Saprospiraceae bacterium]|nr:hypothetical protein [Saprospiraceae bacterium]
MILRFAASMLIVLATGLQDGHTQEFASNNAAIHLGVKAATQIHGIVNQNNFGQKEMDYSVPIGFAGGLSLQYKINARSFIQAEFCYQEQGQWYKDQFNGKSFRKRVALNYWTVPVMFKYMVSPNSAGYRGVNISKPKWFVGGGLQYGKLARADIEWEINGLLTNFMTFVTDGGNPNQAILEVNGTPADEKEFYQETDIVFVASWGFHSHLNPIVTATVELRGGIGLTDINAEIWRLENRQGKYGSSHSTFLGIHAGIAFRIFEEN